jgi:hypothetical protein
MRTSLRKRWDTVNDCPSVEPVSLADEAKRYIQATAVPVAEYRAKLVKMASGEVEISVTPTQYSSVINARMGFNPLLDCPRRTRSTEEQAQRDSENRQRATRRAKYKVRCLIKTIEANLMLTFTYRENVTDRERVARDWKEFLRLYHQRYPDWLFVCAPEEQERGAIHLHVAVKGKQDIRWLLRCWLLAIGQPADEVNDWFINGNKLGDKSLGSVNVEPPKRRWGSCSAKWKANKLSSYLTKYIGKEFETTLKGKKKYWHSKGIEQPLVERFYLKATDWIEAVREAMAYIKAVGVRNIDAWGDSSAGVVWITGGGAIVGGEVLYMIKEEVEQPPPVYTSDY